jgi:putative peptidoglycan lipid II flippase
MLEGGQVPPAPPATDVSRRRAWNLGARQLGGAALIVTAASLGSKLLGLLRDTVFAGRFGASDQSDAYFFAANLPLIVFAAVGVSITNVFIPLFAAALTERDQAEAERFAARVNTAVTLTVGVLIVILELLAGPVVRALTPDWVAAKQQLAVGLLRIMAPLILFYGWSGVVGGVLNVRGFFGPNAAMGIPQNLVIIATILLATLHGRHAIAWVAWGSLGGTLTTYLVQLPALRRSRFRVGWRLDLRDARLRQMGALVVPAAITALAQQTGYLFNNVASTWLRGGLLTDFTYATRVQMLAYSLLGMSIATVIYPTLAASAATRDLHGFRQAWIRGLGLINLVTVPVAIGLLVLRVPVVHVLFQHGRFTAADSHGTAWPLAFLAVGTLIFGWQDFLNRAFFSFQDTRTPMFASLIGVGATIVGGLAFLGPLKQAGLGLGMTCGWAGSVTFLIWRLRRRHGLLGGRRLAGSAARMLASALAAFLPAERLYMPLVRVLHGHWPAYAAALVVSSTLALTVYAALCRLLRVPELQRAAELAAGLLGRARRVA